jgi:PBP1b-binding outer membrane lipoprotein LpoB
MLKILIALVVSIGLLTACSDDKAPARQAAPAAKAPAAAPAVAPAAAPSVAPTRTGTIDHSRDVVEFELRRALGGVERMLTHFRAEGYDTAELESLKAELEQKLGGFSG